MQARIEEAPPPEATVGPSPEPAEVDEADAVAPVVPAPSIEEGDGRPPREGVDGASWPDESAEATFLSEARDRGEVLVPAKAREEIAGETEAQPLPALDVLVQRIPPEVREALDELFRARFVRVVRVPRKALKG